MLPRVEFRRNYERKKFTIIASCFVSIEEIFWIGSAISMFKTNSKIKKNYEEKKLKDFI